MRLNQGWVGLLHGITRDTFSCLFSDEFILFLGRLCLMCQMRMSGNGSERVCPAPFAGSGFRKLRETHTTKTLGGFFPTSVSG